MKRPEALYAVYDSRVQASEALAAIVQRRDATESLSRAAAALHQTGATLGAGTEGCRYEQFARLLDIMGHLLRWAQAVRSAEVEADRYLRAAKQHARELARELSDDMEDKRLSLAVSKVITVMEIDEIEQIAEYLFHTPLPLPLFFEISQPRGSIHTEPIARTKPEVSVAFASFALNNMPFRNPHTVEPGVLYDLTVELRVSRWPDGAEELVLDVTAVEPPAVYELPRFAFPRPNGTSPHLFSQTGRMLLHVPQTLLSRPLEFAYRARFLPKDCEIRVVVEGQRHLRVQSFDPERNPQTGYREVDRRLMEIRDQARARPGVRDKELGDFLQILGTLARIAGQALQDNVFPGASSEQKFQDELKKLIRADPRIGSELEEHPRAAGGITDLSFCGIRIELKVEPDRFVTIEDAHRFLGQTTQYVAGSDRRFGVLCLLDCSQKLSALGTVANDIALQVVPPPDRLGKLPLLVGIVIVRGNLPIPSSLARH